MSVKILIYRINRDKQVVVENNDGMYKQYIFCITFVEACNTNEGRLIVHM